MVRSLPNYLRSFRQKAHLTQEEVAFLLGGEHGTTVQRHEENVRVPHFDTLLRYSAVFSADPRELFAGRYEVLEAEVRARAAALLAQLGEAGVDPQKVLFLQMLASPADVHFVPCDDE
jgi:transcriptional regulator with XRE-family HTH domain